MLIPTTTTPSPAMLRLRDLWRLVTLNRKMGFGLAILTFFVLVAIFGPLFFPQDPNAFSQDVLQPPSAAHLLGTTQTGQDVLTQVVVGTRISLLKRFHCLPISSWCCLRCPWRSCLPPSLHTGDH